MKKQGNHKGKPFFVLNGVEKSSRKHIEITFETLIFQKREKPFDWYKTLDLDKSYASKIRRGLIIPPRWLRIKISNYFDVDTSAIWYSQEMLLVDKEDKVGFITILQACLFAFDGMSEEEVMKLNSDYNPELVHFGFELCEAIKKKEIIKNA